MRLLVTGGAGFIGSNFIRLTLNERPDVHLTVLDAFTYAANVDTLADVSSQIQIIHGSINDAPLVDALVAEHDVIINFAAETHNDNSLNDPMPFITTNILGVAILLESIRKHNKRFHHISTDEVFGDLDLTAQEKFCVDSPYRPSSPYSASKASADHLIRAWIRSFGIQATISNCSNNYGPYQHVEKFIPRQITQLLNNDKPKLYGNGEHIRDWIHVDDHNRGIWAILDRGDIGQTYLLGAHGTMSNSDVVRLLLEIFGRSNRSIDFIADRPGHDRKYSIDATRSYHELDWHPTYTDLRNGLEHTVDWYRNNKPWWCKKKLETETTYTLRDQQLSSD